MQKDRKKTLEHNLVAVVKISDIIHLKKKKIFRLKWNHKIERNGIFKFVHLICGEYYYINNNLSNALSLQPGLNRVDLYVMRFHKT